MRAGKEGPATHPRPWGLTAVVQAPPCATLLLFPISVSRCRSFSLSPPLCLYASLCLLVPISFRLSQSVSFYIPYCLPLSCSLHLSLPTAPVFPSFSSLSSEPACQRFQETPTTGASTRERSGGWGEAVDRKEGNGPRPLTFRRDHEIWENLCGCKPSGSHPRRPFLRVHYYRCAGSAARLL